MSTRNEAHRLRRFGEFSVDLDRGMLFRGDDEVHLRPKAFQVLTILLDNHGRLVTKAALHDAVWKRVVVTDDSLAHCIADIRRALADSGFEMIKTVPRRGYIFDHGVSRVTTPDAESPEERHRSAYRLGAVVAALVAAIMLVIGAGRSGEIAETGAGEDSRAVAAVAGADRSSADIDARNDHEKGRFFFKRRGFGDLQRAEDCFRSALERDPEFAGAWIALAGVYSVRFSEGEIGREEALALLGDATRHAITLAPDSAEAHVRRAFYYSLAGDPLLARQYVETAITLDPNDVLVLGMSAGVLAHRSRFDEAVELQRRAIQGDPTSALQHHNLVWYLLAAGRVAEAAAAAEQYHALKPRGLDEEGKLLADVKILQGNYEQALLMARNMADGPTRDRNLAMIHHELGQIAEADAALQRLLASEDEQARVHIAEVFAHRGDTDAALSWLAHALESPGREVPTRHQLWHDTLRVLSPYLIELRSDERWQALYADLLNARDDSGFFLARAPVVAAVERK
jgi:DNA-binding winged helix-turn-helix (wHTH) protein/tetratricopeptide (TPR) repeat protein